MSVIDKFSVIEFKRERLPGSPENIVKIDGKELKGICNVSIKYGLSEPMPIVTLEFLAKKVKGKVKGSQLISKRNKK